MGAMLALLFLTAEGAFLCSLPRPDLAAQAEDLDFSKKSFDELVRLIDHPLWRPREKALEQLETLLPTLTKAQLDKLADKYIGTDFEIPPRLDRIAIKGFFRGLIDLTKAPKTIAVLAMMEMNQTRGSAPVRFQLGGFRGEVKEGDGKNLYLTVRKKWAEHRQHLQIGDGDGAIGRLKELKELVRQMGEAQFSSLNLRRDGKLATQEDVLAFLDAARKLTEEARPELKRK
jgi:hypothetical protein